jgi:hypothetical protein
MYNKKLVLGSIISVFILVLASLVVFTNLKQITNLSFPGATHFARVAESLWQGRVSLTLDQLQNFPLDTVKRGDQYFWPQGIFPGLLLFPLYQIFQLFPSGTLALQPITNIILSGFIFYFAYRVALQKKFSVQDALLTASAFCFGSIFVYVTNSPQSWFFSQTVTVFLIFAILMEWLVGKQRYWLIGLLYSATLLTRVTAVFSITFFIYQLIIEKETFANKKSKILQLVIPLIVGVFVYLSYNYLITGSLFENAYKYAQVAPYVQEVMLQRYGLFNIQNIFSNIYLYFFYPLKPIYEQNTYHLIAPFFTVDPLGASFFIISPIFAKLIWQTKEVWKQTATYLVSTLPTLFLLLTYYASGYWTLGPRYLLDLLPFWYVALLLTFKDKKLSFWHILLIMCSAFINFYLVYSTNFATGWDFIKP